MSNQHHTDNELANMNSDTPNREKELQRIVDGLNNTSRECLAAQDELSILRLNRELAALRKELCKLGLCSGHIEHYKDNNGIWWIAMKCVQIGTLHSPMKSNFQDKPASKENDPK